MISKTLKNNKIKNFKIYPVPDLYDDYKWADYIIRKLPKFDVAYSGNEWAIRCFKKHKIKAVKIKLVKGLSSTKVRDAIIKNKNWKKLVPEEVYSHILKINGIKRVRSP